MTDGLDWDALADDFRAITNRLETISGYGRLTTSQKAAVAAVQVRVDRVVDRLAAYRLGQPAPDPDPPVEPGPDPEPEPEPEPTPEPEPVDEFPPPPRSRTVVGAPNGTIVQEDTHYVDPQGALIWSDGIAHVTVTGARSIPTIIRGWRDVHIEGRPDRYIDSGPRSDGGDLLQVKSVVGGPWPEDIVIRYWHGHDVDRSGNPSGHPDGVQFMAGKRVTFVDCLMTNVAVQPYFVKHVGVSAGGGPIEDITFLRCSSVAGSAEGFYSFHVDATDSGNAPWRVKLVDCSGDRNYHIDSIAAAQGCEAINWTAL